MPTQTFYRTWCKTCQDWTWHRKPFKIDVEDAKKSDWRCKACDTEITDTTFAEIPEEKIIEQRQRYKEHKTEEFKNIMNIYSGMGSMMSSGWGDGNTYIENDAGQKDIDEALLKKRAERLAEKKRLIEEYNIKFKGIGRNDICRCGSGIKYKKCCLKLKLD